MLVLSRKKGQSIVIQDDIEIIVLEVEGDTIKLGISAPKDVQILRKELLASIKETNEEAASSSLDLQNLSKEIKNLTKNF